MRRVTVGSCCDRLGPSFGAEVTRGFFGPCALNPEPSTTRPLALNPQPLNPKPEAPAPLNPKPKAPKP